MSRRESGKGAGGAGNNVKLLVIGRSATGKDRLVSELRARGWSFLKSYTTRPRRSEDEDTHVFIGDAEADRLFPDAVATAEINGRRYFAMREQVEECDAYVIDPGGMMELLGNMPDTLFRVVYVEADKERRKDMSLSRVPEGDREAEAEVFDSRCESEDALFGEFEDVIAHDFGSLPGNVVGVHTFFNEFEEEPMERFASVLCSLAW